MGPELIYRYFPGLDSLQKERLGALGQLYAEWNSRINVISRKDTDHLYERHVLHSLAIARIWTPDASARILDVGTGGGFPGIPLAIMYPEAEFTLADSIGKKVRVVTEVATALGLKNVTGVNARVESLPGKFDYVVSRAVTALPTLTGWVWDKIQKGQKGSIANGLMCLKGGDLTGEIGQAGRRAVVYEIADFFEGEFFETKKIVYLPR